MIEWRGLVTCSNPARLAMRLKFSTVGPDHDVGELNTYSIVASFHVEPTSSRDIVFSMCSCSFLR